MDLNKTHGPHKSACLAAASSSAFTMSLFKRAAGICVLLFFVPFQGFGKEVTTKLKMPPKKTYEVAPCWKLDITESGQATAICGNDVWHWKEKISYPERVLFSAGAQLFVLLGSLGDTSSGLGKVSFFSIDGSLQSQIFLRDRIPTLEELSRASTKTAGSLPWITSAQFIRSGVILELDVCKKKRVWIDPVSGHSEALDLSTHFPSKSTLEAQAAKIWQEVQASNAVKSLENWSPELSPPFPETAAVSYYVYAANNGGGLFGSGPNTRALNDSHPFAKIRVVNNDTKPELISIATTVEPYPLDVSEITPEIWTRYNQERDRAEAELVQSHFQKREKLPESVRAFYCTWTKLHVHLAKKIRSQHVKFFDSLEC